MGASTTPSTVVNSWTLMVPKRCSSGVRCGRCHGGRRWPPEFLIDRRREGAMSSGAGPLVRDARDDDVAAICGFGEAHIRPHYAPLIGAEAAAAQVRDWWNPAYVGAAVGRGQVVVADADGQ